MNKAHGTLLVASALLISQLASCGNSGSQSISYRTLNYKDGAAGSSTGLTGIRAVANSSDVYITGNYFANGFSTGTLYVGPISGGGTYYNYVYPSSPVATTSGTNVYSADNGVGGNVELVGTYTIEATGARAYGFLYDGPIPAGGPSAWRTIDFPQSQVAGPVLNTYPHSIMGGLVVGNYNTPISGGNAFVYDVASKQYSTLVKPGSRFTSAYGVWWNGGASYTIVGGYSDAAIDSSSEDPAQLTTGFIVDYDSATGQYSNWTALSYPQGVVTHFEGITSDGNGGYNLAGAWLNSDGSIGAGLANVPRDSSGGFNPSQVTWIPVAYPGASTTTADTVYQNYILGIYVLPGSEATNGYVATIPTSWY